MRSTPFEHDAPEWLRYRVEQSLPAEFVTWIPGDDFAASALTRVPRYPQSVGDADSQSLSIDAARNERRSAQLAAASSEPLADLRAEVSTLDGPDGSEIPSDAIDVRYVGYVPVEEAENTLKGFPPVEEISDDGVSGDRAPDVVGDPLLECESVDVPPHRAQAIWFTFDVPADQRAGRYRGEIRIATGDREPTTYDVELAVRDVAVPDPADGDFYLDVWMHPDAVASGHGVEPWSERHWELLESYFEDLAAASQRAITASVVHEPWQREWIGGEWRPQTETGFSSLVEWRYDGEWTFDFERFDRYVEAALDCGVGPSISAFSMLTFRGQQRLSYYDTEGEFVVDRLDAGDDRWREAWTAFLRAFGDHLDERGWLEQTFLAFDERPADLMEAALDVAEAAPHDFDDRIRVAGSDEVEAFADDLSVHYNHLPLDERTLDDRRAAGRTTTYYVTMIGHPRTLSYSPAVEGRMLPWIAAANDLDGLLRWSYNSWPDDVFDDPVFRYSQGAEYLVYPGEDGPLSSIRWELVREGIGEFELHRRADTDLAEAVELAVRNPDGREKDPNDLVEARQRLFAALD